MNIRFLGAVKGVTGSCHLIEFQGKRVMLDCGMFQGKDDELNYRTPDFNPADIDYLLLSHSHIDHSGKIPYLVKNGFRGRIYCSKPTYDLCEIMLLDSAHIQEMETEWENRKATRSGRPLTEPLYTTTDAQASFKYFNPVLYEQVIQIDDTLTVRFNDAGHVLGSSIIEMWFKEGQEETKVVYSGDLGMKERPILKDPAIITTADYVIMESTYGNRVHENIEHREEELLNIILKTVMRGGTVIIPSFAVGRTQEIIYELNKYYDSHLDSIGTKTNLLKNIPVYIDSPLAAKATEVFSRSSYAFDDEAKEYLMRGDNPLSFKNLYFTHNAEESKALNFSDEPKIIISSSGMCEAGRIKHHLKHNLWKKNCSVIFVGYQAEGTLGRKIRDGVKNVKILGEDIHVNAEVYSVEGFSGHADKNGLIDWLRNFTVQPEKLFIVHGEPDAKAEFAKEVKETLGMDCVVPEYGEVYEIKGKTAMQGIGSTTKYKANFAAIRQTGQADMQGTGTEEEKSLENSMSEETVKELLEEIRSIKGLFEKSVDLIEGFIHSETATIDDYNKIGNLLLNLESDLVNLTALGGK